MEGRLARRGTAPEQGSDARSSAETLVAVALELVAQRLENECVPDAQHVAMTYSEDVQELLGEGLPPDVVALQLV